MELCGEGESCCRVDTGVTQTCSWSIVCAGVSMLNMCEGRWCLCVFESCVLVYDVLLYYCC